MAASLGTGVSSQTVTEVVDNSFPVLRLRLTNTANEIGAAKPHHESRGTFEKMKKKFQDMFFKAKAEANLEPEVTAAAKQRNINRIEAIFNDMKDKLDQQKQETIASMHTLTPQQQEDVVTFWEAAGTFFKDVLNWLKDMFSKVMELLRAGWKLVKESVSEMFKTVSGWLQVIFG